MRTCCLIRFVLFFDLVGVARISKRLPRALARDFLGSAADGSMKSYQILVIDSCARYLWDGRYAAIRISCHQTNDARTSTLKSGQQPYLHVETISLQAHSNHMCAVDHGCRPLEHCCKHTVAQARRCSNSLAQMSAACWQAGAQTRHLDEALVLDV